MEVDNQDTIIQAVREEVQRAAAEPMKAMQEALESVKAIHTDLMSLQERDSKADDVSVIDKTLKRVDAEKEVATMQDEVRRMFNEIKGEYLPTPSRSDTPFKGFFLGPDSDKAMHEFRTILHQTENMETAMKPIIRAITSATTLASAGKLNPDQEQQFIDWMIERQLALNTVRIRRMSAPQMYLDELVTAGRQIIAATEGTAPAVADAITTSRRTLTTVETVWAEDVTDSFIEDNIERGNVEDHIAMNLAQAFGNDHNDLFWNGDDSDSDAFIGISEGIIASAKADGSVDDYAASGDSTAQDLLENSLKDLDFDYRSNPDVAWFLPDKTVFTLLTELKDRATVLGDSFVTNAGGNSLPFATTRYFGIPVLGDPDLNRGSQDEGVVTPRFNLNWGVQRGIRLEAERNPRKRAVEFTLSARTHQNYAKSAAVVLIDGIVSGLR